MNKKTWVVFVEQGVGHELHDCISEADFYGPFTKGVAESLAEKLNAHFDETRDNEGEPLIATAMPLDGWSAKQVLAEYMAIKPVE
jgi:hypothetical protein